MSEQAIQPTRDVGRPTDMTPGTVDKLAAAFQRGFSVSTACKIARINRTTYYNWLKSSPEFVDRMEGAQEYAKILAGDTVIDILQDIHRGKKDPATGKVLEPKKYSEATRATVAWKYLEKTEKEIFGSQSMLATKTEPDGKGGVTTTTIYATDGQFTQLIDKIGVTPGVEDLDPGQLLEVLEDSSQEGSVAGGEDKESTPPVHSEELQGEHTDEEGMPQP